MESNGLTKLLLLILIVLTVWNTYRIEEELKAAEEAKTESFAESILSQGEDSMKIEALNKKVSALEQKVKTLQSKVNELSRLPKPAPITPTQKTTPASTSTSTATSTPKSTSPAPSTATSSPQAKPTLPKVDAKVRVENRYVDSRTYLPKAVAGVTGTVIITVKVNRLGTVTSVSVNNSSTITDEDVIYNCKETALRTAFAYNPEAPNTTYGTITYTFQ